MNDHKPMTEEEINQAEMATHSSILGGGDYWCSEAFAADAREGWPRALAEIIHRGKILDAALEELARTWNAVGMLGKRDWTAKHLLARFEENTK